MFFKTRIEKSEKKRKKKGRYSAVKISYSISRGQGKLWGAAFVSTLLQKPTKSLSRYLVSICAPAIVPHDRLIGPEMPLGTKNRSLERTTLASNEFLSSKRILSPTPSRRSCVEDIQTSTNVREMSAHEAGPTSSEHLNNRLNRIHLRMLCDTSLDLM